MTSSPVTCSSALPPTAYIPTASLWYGRCWTWSTQTSSTMVPELGCIAGRGASEAHPHLCARPVKNLLSAGLKVKGISHITGGGLYENVPRMLPEGVTRSDRASPPFPCPPSSTMIQEKGDIPERDMYNTFNMGVGLVMAVAKEEFRCGHGAARFAAASVPISSASALPVKRVWSYGK